MSWQEVVETLGEAVEVLGVVVIVIGVVGGLGYAGWRTVRGDRSHDSYRRARQGVGRAILLGLEVLVAGDIIRTVATDPTFTSVGVLALIVLIRTFLSFTLELEVTGRWPWQGAEDA